MLRETYPYYLAGEAVAANADLVVTNKYTGQPAACVARADPGAIDRAIAAAVEAAEACRRMPSFARADILRHIEKRLAERHEELAHVLAVEVGKPIRDARGEVTRAVDTFHLAAEEATRLGGEYMPLDISPRAEGYEGIWRRFPIGPCAFITPFNFPVNLAAHKIAPAIAVGCPFVLKPASLTPISAILLAEIIAETDWPRGACSVLPCRAEDAAPLAVDDRLKLLSFTGSPEVGWALTARAGRKRVLLELGGNAAVIVDRDVDLEHAVARIIIGAFYQSGQSCISVQRIFVHAAAHEELRARLVAAARQLKTGDPLRGDTFLGPLISQNVAERVESWVDAARARGAQVLCGGKRDSAFYEATLLERVPDDCEVSCREVFGPVALIEPFHSFEAAVARVNDSDYGLQAGVFTRSLDAAMYAWNNLDVGAVLINDVPSFRVDNMPYGGVKESGLGREGVRFAMEEMTEIKLLVLNRIGRRAD